MAIGIPPDLTDTATAIKKGVVPAAGAVPTPKVGEIWPRGSKTTAG